MHHQPAWPRHANNAKNQGVAAMKIPTESVGRSVGAEGGEAKGDAVRTYE